MELPDRHPRVLVVDDQPLVRKGLAWLLQEHAVKVCEAADVEAAVEAAGECDPDVILLDGELNGLRPSAVIPRLDAAAPRAAIVVLALHPDPREARGAFASGADGYLSKQASLAEFELALEEIERGGQYLDPRLGASLAAADAPIARAAALSQREQRILEGVAAGMTNRQIAQELGLSVRTIEANRARAQRKLRLRTRADVVAYVRGGGTACAATNAAHAASLTAARPRTRR